MIKAVARAKAKGRKQMEKTQRNAENIYNIITAELDYIFEDNQADDFISDKHRVKKREALVHYQNELQRVHWLIVPAK